MQEIQWKLKKEKDKMKPQLKYRSAVLVYAYALFLTHQKSSYFLYFFAVFTDRATY